MRQQVTVPLTDASSHQTLSAAETNAYMTFIFPLGRMVIHVIAK